MIKEPTKYPTREECLAILKQLGCGENVIEHILVVTEIALTFASKIPEADIALVEAGALLHDMGRSKTHGIAHAVEGAKLARERNLPEEVVRIIERHICAGIPKEDAIQLGLPEKDYFPETIEEKIVAHADNLVEGNNRCTIERSIQILNAQNLPQVAGRVKKLHLELSDIVGKNLDNL